jgi:Replicase family
VLARRNSSPISPAAKLKPDNVDIVDNAIPEDWRIRYSATYEARSRKARRQRADGREAAHERRHDQAAPLLTTEQRDAVDRAVDRAKAKKALVDGYFRHGFRWSGGYVSGNKRYYRAPFVHRGLVSDDDPLLKLFVQYTPRVRRGPSGLRTGNSKSESKEVDSKLLALNDEYVAGVEAMRGFFRVDIDADFPSFAAIRTACATVGILPPHIIVGHSNRDGVIMHPHLIWLLDSPVCFTGKGRSAPKAFWYRVLRGLTYALLAHGADHGAVSNPMRVKNPVSPLWSRDVGHAPPYTLSELAACLRMDVTPKELEEGRPADLPRSECLRIDRGAGSNALFIGLRDYARANVVARRVAGIGADEWRHELVTFAIALTDNERHARSTAMRVADYTWTRSEPRQRLDEQEVHRRRADAGRATAAGRRDASTTAALAAYRQIVAEGGKPTQAAVRDVCGLGIATVKRCWPSVLSAVQTGELGIRRSLSDKKSVVAGRSAAETRPAGGGQQAASSENPDGQGRKPGCHTESSPDPASLEQAVPGPPVNASRALRLKRPDFLRLGAEPTERMRADAAARIAQGIGEARTPASRAADYASWKLTRLQSAA